MYCHNIKLIYAFKIWRLFPFLHFCFLLRKVNNWTVTAEDNFLHFAEEKCEWCLLWTSMNLSLCRLPSANPPRASFPQSLTALFPGPVSGGLWQEHRWHISGADLSMFGLPRIRVQHWLSRWGQPASSSHLFRQLHWLIHEVQSS